MEEIDTIKNKELKDYQRLKEYQKNILKLIRIKSLDFW